MKGNKEKRRKRLNRNADPTDKKQCDWKAEDELEGIHVFYILRYSRLLVSHASLFWYHTELLHKISEQKARLKA